MEAIGIFKAFSHIFTIFNIRFVDDGDGDDTMAVVLFVVNGF